MKCREYQIGWNVLKRSTGSTNYTVPKKCTLAILHRIERFLWKAKFCVWHPKLWKTSVTSSHKSAVLCARISTIFAGCAFHLVCTDMVWKKKYIGWNYFGTHCSSFTHVYKTATPLFLRYSLALRQKNPKQNETTTKTVRRLWHCPTVGKYCYYLDKQKTPNQV